VGLPWTVLYIASILWRGKGGRGWECSRGVQKKKKWPGIISYSAVSLSPSTLTCLFGLRDVGRCSNVFTSAEICLVRGSRNGFGSADEPGHEAKEVAKFTRHQEVLRVFSVCYSYTKRVAHPNRLEMKL
jgi:hypothetical protein